MNTIGRVVLIVAVATVGVILATRLTRLAREDPSIEGRNPTSLYNPVHAGEVLPQGFRDLLPRDAILPIYDPQFVPAAESGWHEKALVIGLEINGDTRAYPVSALNRREIVNDHVGRTPVLVTW
jgi:hypothetical protein